MKSEYFKLKFSFINYFINLKKKKITFELPQGLGFVQLQLAQIY
jgi:hypothetical protein